MPPCGLLALCIQHAHVRAPWFQGLPGDMPFSRWHAVLLAEEMVRPTLLYQTSAVVQMTNISTMNVVRARRRVGWLWAWVLGLAHSDGPEV